MAIHKIKGSVATTVIADKANDTWLVTKTGSIDTLSTGIDASGNKNNRQIIVEGHVAGDDYGIVFGSAGGGGAGRIVIEKGGDVGSADTAIFSWGDGQEIVNRGKIEAVEGIVTHGDNVDFVNNGTIDGANTGVRFEGGGGRFVNNGKMVGEAAVYAQDSADNGRIVVVNNGLMDNDKGAIQLLTDGGHLIRNTGVIKTEVYGGDGRDRFVNDGGKVAGTIDLRDGNDTYIIDRSNIQAAELINNGKDTVRASVDYTLGNHIEKLILTGSSNIDGTGSSYDDRIVGNSGNNRLDGDGGDDLLKGGGGRDVFVFSYHGLHDEVLDFRSGIDRIDMRGWDGDGLENFADVKANATNQGDDLFISLGGSDDLLIHDFHKSDLDKADFIF